MVRSSHSTGAPGRTTRSRAASRGDAGRSAMRSSGRAKSNRSVRMARQVIGSSNCPMLGLRLKGHIATFDAAINVTRERGHPGQTGHRRRHLAPSVRPRHRRGIAGRPRDVSGAAVERRAGIARGRAERRRDALFRACRLGAAARAQSAPAGRAAAAPPLSTRYGFSTAPSGRRLPRCSPASPSASGLVSDRNAVSSPIPASTEAISTISRSIGSSR